MAVNHSYVKHEESSNVTNEIVNCYFANTKHLLKVYPENSFFSSSSSLRSFKRRDSDVSVTQENLPLTCDQSPDSPDYKNFSSTKHISKVSSASSKERKLISRRRRKGSRSLSFDKGQLRLSINSDFDPIFTVGDDEDHFSKDISRENNLSSVDVQSLVNEEFVEKRPLRFRRQSTPHLTASIAEDCEFDFSFASTRQSSCKENHVTIASKPKKSASRKKSDSLVTSGIPFINPLRSNVKTSLSVDDLSQSVDINQEIKSSFSLFQKSSGFGANKTNYKELTRSRTTPVLGDCGSKLSNSPPNPPHNHRTDDAINSASSFKSKKKRGSLSRHKKLSLPILWRNVDVDMMTNHQYDASLHGDSSNDQGADESDASSIPRMKSFDAVVFDVLRVSPEEYARQLTLLDWVHFAAIKPDEISSCGWTKKDKWKRSPNVSALTQRFNHTSFWVIHEILHASTTKIRAETLTLFIKTAKKLHELNNIHSLMAIVQSLNSSSIIRLSKAWAIVSKNYRATFERLLSLVKEDDNRAELRSHMEDIRLPCIPFLGMYLTDVMYIDSAFPDTGGLESHERANKLNNILRVLSEFQQSKYDHLQEQPHIKKYLHSVKYIEELQKFLEEDNYKLSLKIEPLHSTTTPNGTNGTATGQPDLSLSRHVFYTPPTQEKFVPGHRKSRSLGKDINFGTVVPLRNKLENPKAQKKRQSWYSRAKQRDSTVWHRAPIKGFSTENLNNSGSLTRGVSPIPAVAMTTSLLDDSIISTPTSLSSSLSRTPAPNGTNGSLGSSRSNSGSEFSEQDETSSSSDRTLDISSSEYRTCTFEGCLKRKCVLKQGKKPSISSWIKYWVCICGSKLIYFASKSFRGNDRENFKSRPCKAVSILGWMVLSSNDSSRSGCFQLNNPESGNMYRFHCESKDVALVWISNLDEASKGRPQPECDLINLEDT